MLLLIESDWIFLLLAIFFVIFGGLLDNNKGGYMFILCIIIGALLWILRRSDIMNAGDYIIHNIGTSILLFLGYVAVGIGWSFYKWRQFLIKKYKYNKKYVKYEIEIVSISLYKGELFCWIFYWLFYALWELCQNPFRRLFILIYNQYKGLYDSISESIKNSIYKDLKD